MKKMLIAVAGSLLLSSSMSFAEDSPVISVKRLTLETATRIAQGAIDECRGKGIQIGATVVDRNGIVQVAMRDTLAPTITLEISHGKAAAAANFSVNTAALADRANTPIGRVPGIVMSTGGVLIEAAGSMYGAVGVSGAPSGKTDEECALAGVAAVMDDLEMM